MRWSAMTLAVLTRLYWLAKEGKLEEHETFTEIYKMLTESVRRLNSANPKAKFGQRYSARILGFMTLMRAHRHTPRVDTNIYAALFQGHPADSSGLFCSRRSRVLSSTHGSTVI